MCAAMDHVTRLWEHGYAIVRGVYSPADVATIADEMDRLKAEALRHPASYRDRNLVYVLRPHPTLRRHLRFIHWPSYISPVMARYRIDRRQLEIVEPLLGRNLKQIANQATWKTPGSEELWLPHTLHASGPNRSTIDRRAYINGYVVGDNCDRGEWAFRDGEPCELGEPVL